MIPEDIFEMQTARRGAPEKAQFTTLARRAGFQLAGVAPARPLEDYSIYNQWINDRMEGPMGYLADHRGGLRADPRNLLASARSVLCAGLLYNAPGPERHSVSRYAWGAADYHDLLRASMEWLVQELLQAWGPFEYRIAVDTAPLLERSLARQAGLGWIGRNTCLINEPHGSWFFLGEILVSVELPPDSPPADRCGTCRRCIDACPTAALVAAPGGGTRLDARRCISTWTIEQRGPWAEEQRAESGGLLFGCDICQEVCPWNRRAPYTLEPGFQPLHADPDLAELSKLTTEDFRDRFRRTPLWRTKYSGILRNAATVMGNSGDRSYIPALQRLIEGGDETVAEHARWALSRLEAGA